MACLRPPAYALLIDTLPKFSLFEAMTARDTRIPNPDRQPIDRTVDQSVMSDDEREWEGGGEEAAYDMSITSSALDSSESSGVGMGRE